MRRPSTEELDAMEAAIELRYPWFAMLWPTCPRGHRMMQLGMNPEPFVVVVEIKASKGHAIRCVRCKREADQRSRRRGTT